MSVVNIARPMAKAREWTSFHGSAVPLQNDPFSVGQDFVRALHHRVCQPLTSLSCMLELMQMGRKDDCRLMEQLRSAVEQSDRVMSTIAMFRQLFEASSYAGGHSASLEEALLEVTEDLRPVAEHHQVRLVLEMGDCTEVAMERKHLQRALWNVVQNCIELTAPPGRVVLNAEDALLIIQDESDCSSSEVANIFDPFSFCARGNGSSPVSNLPLAVTQRILVTHAGEMRTVYAGKGRRFELRFRPTMPA